jgi:hypothetical protein
MFLVLDVQVLQNISKYLAPAKYLDSRIFVWLRICMLQYWMKAPKNPYVLIAKVHKMISNVMYQQNYKINNDYTGLWNHFKQIHLKLLTRE